MHDAASRTTCPGHCCPRPLAKKSWSWSGLTPSRWSPSPWLTWCLVTWSNQKNIAMIYIEFVDGMDTHVALVVEPRGQEPIDCFLSFALRIRELMSLIALQCVARWVIEMGDKSNWHWPSLRLWSIFFGLPLLLLFLPQLGPQHPWPCSSYS